MPDLKPTVIRTERLVLRWLEERDTEAMFTMFADREVTRYWGFEPWTDMAQAEEFIAHALAGYRDGTWARLGVELRTSGTVIGQVALHHFFDQNRRCEVGYSLASRYWGKGYASEALEAALDYAFRELGMNRIEADIDPRNEASARLLERMGFRKEGYMPERWIVHGETADTAFYGLLRRYWDERGSHSSAVHTG